MRNNTGEKSIDVLVRDFLLAALFDGALEEDCYLRSARRAYRDTCRTLHVKGHQPQADEAKEEGISIVSEGLRSALTAAGLAQEGYDAAHRAICDDLVRAYAGKDAGIAFTYGHAQKWANMAAKYLVVLGVPEAVAAVPVLHAPIDARILAAARRDLGVRATFGAWSKIGGYEPYFEFQKALRAALEPMGKVPLLWEMDVWNERSAARA